MGTNNILVFCPDGTESAGDVLALEAYRTDAHRLRGHQPGIARRELENKALRQATWMAAALAQFIVNKTGKDVIDAGSVASLATALADAFGADIAALWAAINALGSGGTGGDSGPYMPLAKASAGVGQLIPLILPNEAQHLALPSGGTWAYWYGQMRYADGTFHDAIQKTGISPGGTTLYSGSPQMFFGFAWRIA